MATGSGKTLLMHVNIKQYLYYLEHHGRRRDLNRIILLTPNEGLSQQHLAGVRAVGHRRGSVRKGHAHAVLRPRR